MSRFLALTVIGTLAAPQLFASDAVPSAKRQVVNCMIKQMTANKTISYNDASKLCKDQIRAQTVMADTMKPAGINDERNSPSNQ